MASKQYTCWDERTNVWYPEHQRDHNGVCVRCLTARPGTPMEAIEASKRRIRGEDR